MLFSLCLLLAAAESLEPHIQRGVFHMRRGEFSADGRVFLSYDNMPNDFVLWDVRLARVLRQPRISGTIGYATLGADGRTVFFSVKNELWRYDSRTQQMTKTKIGSHDARRSLIFIANREHTQILAWDEYDRFLTVYDLATERALFEVPWTLSGVDSATLSPNGRMAVVTTQNKLYGIEVPSGRVLWQRASETNPRVGFRDDEAFVTNETKFDIMLVDARTGATLQRHRTKGQNKDEWIADLAVSKALVAYVFANDTTRSIYRLDATTLAPKAPIAFKALSLAFSQDGRVLAAGETSFYDASSGRLLAASEDKPQYTMNQVIMSPNGRYMILYVFGGELQIVDLSSGEVVLSEKSLERLIERSPNGRYLFLKGNARLRVFDTQTLKFVQDSGLSDLILDYRISGSDAGDRFVGTNRSDETKQRIYKYARSMLSVEKTVDFGEKHMSPQMLPDGKSVVARSTDGLRVIVINVDSGAKKIIASGGPHPRATLYVPSEKRFFVFDNEGISAVDLNAGKETARYRFDKPLSVPKVTLHWDEKTARLVAVVDGDLYELERTLTLRSKRPLDISWGSGDCTAIDPLGRFFLTTSEGQIDLRNRESLRTEVSYISRSAEERGFVTDQRHYWVTKALLPKVHFVDASLRIYPFESFDLVFNRPDLVLERIGRANPASKQLFERAWERRVKKAGLTPADIRADAALPEVELVGPEPPPETTAPTVTLTVRGKAAGAPLDRVRVAVNDVPLGASIGVPISGDTKIEVPLSAGLNRINVTVRDKRGLESPAALMAVRYIGVAPPSRLIVVAVGVSQYKQRDMSLAYAAKDAEDVSAQLAKRTTGASVRLLDANATREAVLGLRKQLQATTVHDRVVLFFAGHGLLSDKLDYWFATHDVVFDAPEGSGVSFDEIDGLLDGIPARQKLLLMDTCHSGELEDEERASLEKVSVQPEGAKLATRAFRGLKKKANAPKSSEALRGIFSDLQRGSGTAVIASSGGAEFALESDKLKNGVFSYALIELLQAAPKLSVSGLGKALGPRVFELTGGAQKPSARRELVNADFDL